VRSLLLGSIALFFVGVLLVALSIAEGGASVSLVVIVPVISGSSLTFLVGVALLIAGFVSFLFAVTEGMPSEETPSLPGNASPADNSGGAGGFVLIGPVPIVFGSWRGIARRTRWWLAFLGAALLIAFVIAFAWLLR